MRHFDQPMPVASAELAKTLLGAWLGGEPTDLERELNRSSRASANQTDTEEEERLHLLEAIATRMRSYASLLEDRPMDPALVLCVDLLLHLAQSSRPFPPPAPQESRPKVRTGDRKGARSGVVRLEIAVTPRS